MRVSGDMRTEASMRDERYSVFGPSVHAGDDVRLPLLGSGRRPQEAGKPAVWSGSCATSPADAKVSDTGPPTNGN